MQLNIVVFGGIKWGKGELLEVFRGRSAHVLDAKGRLSIPARFRDILRAKYDQRLIVTNLPNCLVAYPYEIWLELEKKFTQFHIAPPDIQAFQRYFLAAAVECSLDGQGRILIPAPLREEAGLKKDVVLSGMLTYFEIWDKEQLDRELQKARKNFDKHSDMVAAIGADQ